MRDDTARLRSIRGRDAYVVLLDGLSEMRGTLDAIPAKVQRNAVRAVNYAARRGRTDAQKEIEAQVAFPRGYLSPRNGRLTVDTAKSIDDQAEIRGRFRPTSLAQFVTSGKPASPGKRPTPITLAVREGHSTRSSRMFLIRLRAGTADIDTKSNLGVAIRLRPGERVEGKHTMVQMKNGLYLLYGPSISQVYRTVSQEQIPDVEQYLLKEFQRLMGADV